jgi:hypothetical protein
MEKAFMRRLNHQIQDGNGDKAADLMRPCREAADTPG